MPDETLHEVVRFLTDELRNLNRLSWRRQERQYDAAYNLKMALDINQNSQRYRSRGNWNVFISDSAGVAVVTHAECVHMVADEVHVLVFYAR